jgi:N-acylneuraminate cytidylyltransferase
MAAMSEIKAIAVIPARKNSSRVPGKNMRDLAGRPLIDYTLRSVKESRHVEKTIVTSDDQEVLAYTRENYGQNVVSFERREDLAADDVVTDPVVFHAVISCLSARELSGYDVVVTLHPTSPIRVPSLIDDCVGRAFSVKWPVMTVTKHNSFLWGSENPVSNHLDARYYGTLIRQLNGTDRGISQSFTHKDTYMVETGAVYATPVSYLLSRGSRTASKVIGMEVPHSHGVDINTDEDFETVECLIKGGKYVWLQAD